MSFYAGLSIKGYDSPELRKVKKRVAGKLAELRVALDKDIPAKRVDGKLLLATWNIREFGEGRFRQWGVTPSKSASEPPLIPPASASIPPVAAAGEASHGTDSGGHAGADDSDDDEQGMKGRLWESIYYIAEIINRFDLVALQEVRDEVKKPTAWARNMVLPGSFHLKGLSRQGGDDAAGM
jgi:hypothetical protein